MAERLIDKLREFLIGAQGKEVSLSYLRNELRLNPERAEWESIRKSMQLLIKEGVVKASGRNDGIYKVVIPVEPVKWWDDGISEEPLAEFRFPRSYHDDTTFGIENLAEVFAGDLILVSGQSNYGKTAMVLNIMAENLNLMGAVLMGSEYTSYNGHISPKFKRRIKHMDWVQWMNDKGQPRFELLPVGSDYEDYVKADLMNVIDWISLPGEYYLIDRVMKSIKDRVGKGIVIAVLQKNPGADYGEGGPRTDRYADVALKIDAFGDRQSLLTIGKVKAPKMRATGRTWAFEIVDYGANLENIREVVKCSKCWGKGYIRVGQENKRCPMCVGLKYVDK